MAMSWYAFRSKPHKERFVREQLAAREVEVYYPTLRVKPVNPRAARIRPFFPGYMFVHIDIDEPEQVDLNWLPGAYGIVTFGDVPARVPDAFINELRNRLAQIQSAGDLVLDGLKQGDKVRVVKGPLAGYEGIFDTRLQGKDRVRILLAFLSQHPQSVQIDPNYIQKIK